MAMTQSEFLQRAENFFMVKCYRLMSQSKNGQYNSEDDFYKALEESASIMGMSVEQILFAYMFKHIIALSKSIRDGNELDQERLMDIANYLAMLHAYQHTKTEEKT